MYFVILLNKKNNNAETACKQEYACASAFRKASLLLNPQMGYNIGLNRLVFQTIYKICLHLLNIVSQKKKLCENGQL